MTRTSKVTSDKTSVRDLFCVSLVVLSCPCAAYARAGNDDNGGELVGLFILLALILLAYGLPTIIAFLRGHPNRWIILLVNVFFGGTGVGWLGALIWAFHKVHDPRAGNSPGGESGLNLFVNDVKRVQIEPTPPQAKEHDYLDDLERLAKLYSAGHLSEAEYSSEKRKILESNRG